MLRHNLQSKTCVHPHIVSLSDGGGNAVVSRLFVLIFSSCFIVFLLFLFSFFFLYVVANQGTIVTGIVRLSYHTSTITVYVVQLIIK